VAIIRKKLMESDTLGAYVERLEESWALAVAMLEHAPSGLLVSAPGTGKTRLAGQGMGKAVHSVTLGTYATRADLIGLPDLHKAGGFVPGPALLAMRDGARLVVNEINRPETDAVATFLQLCDMADATATGRPDCFFSLSNGERAFPASGFQVIGTSNAPLEALDPALADRLQGATVILPGPHPDAYDALGDAACMVAVKNHAACWDDPERRVSMRSWLAYARYLNRGLDAQQAAKLAFGARAEELLDAMTLAGEDR